MKRKIVFITATRADFGKLKPLMKRVEQSTEFELHIFVTGMHMLKKYGFTCSEVEKENYKNLHKYVNQNTSDSMSQAIAKTISGFNDYITELEPDLIVIHGDRLEALAGATVGAFNNVLTAHVEGGEVSGTIDESIRHAVSKLSHIHFVANENAKKRLLQLGETKQTIHVIGSPDIDLMNAETLPDIATVKSRYEIDFDNYGIALLHPVTTETDKQGKNAHIFVESLKSSGRNFVVIFPNNDPGNEDILSAYSQLRDQERFKIFPSMRFEYFLTLLKEADFIIGNSSAGIREAPHYGVPTIDVGNRQNNRGNCASIKNIPFTLEALNEALSAVENASRERTNLFGDGNSADRFMQTVNYKAFWDVSIQKSFNDF